MRKTLTTLILIFTSFLWGNTQTYTLEDKWVDCGNNVQLLDPYYSTGVTFTWSEAGIGTESNKNKAIDVMRHAAIMNYPEAVSEMRRIEPDNPTWEHKADSLNITFPDFPIIP